MPEISLVVINYNGEQFLSRLFRALDEQTFRDFEFIFIDNNSSDDSISTAHSLTANSSFDCSLIANDSNRGFAPACNQAIRRAQGRWMAFLNNDAWPEPAWLEALHACANENSRVGMVAAKMLFAHAPHQINSAGIAIDRTGIAWDWRGGEDDTPEEAEVTGIFGPCAGAGLYSRSMLETLGGFDDDFFAYHEDVDLAWRARLAGWCAVLQPQARVYHVHSATLGDASPFKRYLLGRNKIWTIVKNYPNPWFARTLPLIVLYDMLAVVYGLARDRDLALVRGRLAGLRGVPKMLARRRHIQRTWQDRHNCIEAMHPSVPPWNVSARYKHLRE